MVPSKIPALPNLNFLVLISMSLTMMQGCLWRNILPATVWTARNHHISTEMSPSPRLRNRDNRKLGRSRGVPRWNIGCRNQNQGHRDPGSLAAAEALFLGPLHSDYPQVSDYPWFFPFSKIIKLFSFETYPPTQADARGSASRITDHYRCLFAQQQQQQQQQQNSSKLIQTQPRPSTYLAGVKNACASVRFQLWNKI